MRKDGKDIPNIDKCGDDFEFEVLGWKDIVVPILGVLGILFLIGMFAWVLILVFG